jgi:hypothetical protein
MAGSPRGSYAPAERLAAIEEQVLDVEPDHGRRFSFCIAILAPVQSDPPILAYARVEAAQRWSWKAAAGWTLIGAIAGPVAMFAALRTGWFGAIACLVLSIVIGILIGRRIRAVSHIAGYTALFGLAGSLPLMAIMVARVDQTDPIGALLSVWYPLVAGISLFVFTFTTAVLTRKR